MIRRRLLIAATAALPLALACCAVLMLLTHRDALGVDAARRDAPVAARDTVAAMLSYRSDSVDSDLATAEKGLTGSFRDDYHKLVAATVIPVAKQKGVSTKARVVDVGVLSAAADQVSLLIFLDQVTVSTDTPTPTTSSARLTVDVERHSGHWLVARVTPL